MTAPAAKPGLQAERTRMAWVRTILSAAAYTGLLLKLALTRHDRWELALAALHLGVCAAFLGTSRVRAAAGTTDASARLKRRSLRFSAAVMILGAAATVVYVALTES